MLRLKNNNFIAVTASVALFRLFYVILSVEGHGNMIDPPMRSSAWRYGFGTPINYDDNGLTCGGFGVSLYYYIIDSKAGRLIKIILI